MIMFNKIATVFCTHIEQFVSTVSSGDCGSHIGFCSLILNKCYSGGYNVEYVIKIYQECVPVGCVLSCSPTPPGCRPPGHVTCDV